MKKQLTITPHIRWMIRRDMPEVHGIENARFEYPWSEDDFIRCLRQRNCIGMVAEHDERIKGYMIYEIHKDRLHVLNFAVHAACERQGIGAAMVRKLVSKLSLPSGYDDGSKRRSRIMLEVRESNLDAQLFFKAMGFRAIRLLRDFYKDTTEDAYLMQYCVQQAAKVLIAD